jgi:hypothetical protein
MAWRERRRNWSISSMVRLKMEGFSMRREWIAWRVVGFDIINDIVSEVVFQKARILVLTSWEEVGNKGNREVLEVGTLAE